MVLYQVLHAVVPPVAKAVWRPTVTGLHHVAFVYPTRAGLADAVRRLRRADWALQQWTDHGTHEAIYVTDPDGNDLMLHNRYAPYQDK